MATTADKVRFVLVLEYLSLDFWKIVGWKANFIIYVQIKDIEAEMASELLFFWGFLCS